METWTKELLKKEREKRKIPLEIKVLNNNYYLYHSTTRWDKKEKKTKKVTDYIGRMTPKGVMEKTSKCEIRTIYEYGNSQLLFVLSEEILGQLKKSFYDRWKEILACAIVKTIRPVPLKLIQTQWTKLHLSQTIDASLSPNTLSDVLREVGRDYASQKEFFDSLITDSRFMAFDLSSIFSYSENLKYAERGQNAEHLYLNQINFMMLFSIDKHLPVLLKPLPGSVKDIKSLKNSLDEINAKNAILVMDRGFASYDLTFLLKENNLNFIFPLKRNFKINDYSIELGSSFVYRERGINCGKKKLDDNNWLYLFEDVKLRAEEETTFIKLIKEGNRKREELNSEKIKFGKITMLSNLELPEEEIYNMYKNREEVEVAFDALKNELENDKTYLSDEDAVRGYFFISFLSLYLHHKILKILKEKNLIEKLSVNEVLLELSKVYEIDLGGKKKLSEIPKKADKIANELGVDIFPKKLGS